MFLTVFEDTLTDSQACLSACVQRSVCTHARVCVCVFVLSTTVRVDVTLSPFRWSSKCFCHVVFHAGLDLGSNLLLSVLHWNTIDYPMHSQTLNINTAAVKHIQTHTRAPINRRPCTEGGGMKGRSIWTGKTERRMSLVTSEYSDN